MPVWNLIRSVETPPGIFRLINVLHFLWKKYWRKKHAISYLIRNETRSFPQNAFSEIFKINTTKVNSTYNAFWDTCARIRCITVFFFCLSRWDRVQALWKWENTIHLHLKRNLAHQCQGHIKRPTLTTWSHFKLCYKAVLSLKWAIPNMFWSGNGEFWWNGGSEAKERQGLSRGSRTLWQGSWKPETRRMLSRQRKRP